MNTTCSKYDKEVSKPMCDMLTEALNNKSAANKLSIGKMQTLITTGWFDMQNAGYVERDTSAVFRQYLQKMHQAVIELALLKPDHFDRKIGLIRETYKIVSNKLITAFERGGRFTMRYGQMYDGRGKQGELNCFWHTFLDKLEFAVNLLPDSIGKDWSAIAITLRHRQLCREKQGSSKYANCPFNADFKEAFEKYSLMTTQQMILLPC